VQLESDSFILIMIWMHFTLKRLSLGCAVHDGSLDLSSRFGRKSVCFCLAGDLD
jgi:hypothetical protein